MTTASEKLKAHYAAMFGPSTLDAHRQEFVAEYAKRVTLDALPQIVAVCEEAQAVADEFVAKALINALDELDKALS